MQDADQADIIFGNLLRELRNNCGKSQEKFGFDADLERVFISMIENGKRRPTLKTLISLSKGLDMPLSEFMLKFEQKYLQETSKVLHKS